MAFNMRMHPRNIYRNPPDFKKMAGDFPEFRPFVVEKSNGKCFINFKDPEALRILTQTLLKKDFTLSVNIPKNCLIPTVPQRLNYILWMEDLLTKLPQTNNPVLGIDIGTGPCCIFPLLGAKKNEWNFIATEIDSESLFCAKNNIESNHLQDKIKVVKSSSGTLLQGVCVSESKEFDFCLCNPPFFDDTEELSKEKKLPHKPKEQQVLCDGGEISFVKQIIDESKILKEKVRIYSSMLGKQKSLKKITKILKSTEGIKFSSTEFCQGNTVRWGVAWTYLPLDDIGTVIADDEEKRKRRKKIKAPLAYVIPHVAGKPNLLSDLITKLKAILNDLQIQNDIISQDYCTVHMRLTSTQNTWSHQRQKRRKLLHAMKQGQVSGSDTSTLENLKYKAAPVEASGNTDLCSSSTVTCPEISPNSNGSVQGAGTSVEQQHCDSLSPTHNASEGTILILNCNLFLEKTDNNITMQCSCETDYSSETMHQVFCMLKNKLSS